MILEEATFEAYGYYAQDLKPQSNKPIWAACELCGRFKATRKSHYYTLCPSCSAKERRHLEESNQKISKALTGKKLSEETKRKISKANKGENSYMYGKTPWNKGIPRSDECKEKISKANKGKHPSDETRCKLSEANRGSNNSNYGRRGPEAFGWRGGAKAGRERAKAKHRKLGYIPLSTSFEGSEGHHITYNYIIHIPGYTHQSIRHNIWTGRNMNAINALVVDFLLRGF